jgi:hypothetical protein
MGGQTLYGRDIALAGEGHGFGKCLAVTCSLHGCGKGKDKSQ